LARVVDRLAGLKFDIAEIASKIKDPATAPDFISGGEYQ
jgi:hypothetical protein